MKDVQAYLKAHKERQLDELMQWLRIPSISADPAYKTQVREAADFIAGKLREAGLQDVEVLPTSGHPIVYGARFVADDLPTILIYGHYDVQPPDPLDLWKSGPFKPEIRKTRVHPDGAIFARGACDDKGQVFMHVKAVEAMIAEDALPCNVKFMIEGEEEVGSSHLAEFCKENTERLRSDVILISDTSILANDTPSITTGLRGLSYVEVRVDGPNRDLHSGVYGGGVANPLNVLCRMIAQLQDEDKRVTIPGFYDDVREVPEAERQAMNQAPFDLKEYCEDLGIEAVEGEKGYTTLERTSIRPTLDVNGIWGGYTGEGAKTVLPAYAQAKISMRLVPDQDPDRITRLFTEHFKTLAPKSVRVSVTPHHGGMPVVTPTDTPEYQAARLAMEETFGQAPIPLPSGGSIPIVALFEQVLGTKSVLMGFGLDSDALHSPNEHYGLFNFYKGIETIPWYFKHYANLKT